MNTPWHFQNLWGLTALTLATITIASLWWPQRVGSAPTFATAICKETYAEIYNKETLDLRIVFGYKDARPARFVGDRYERNALVASLLRPCPAHRYDCGFKRSLDDSDLFIRRLLGPSGKTHTIKLRVVASAVGPDDDLNRRNPWQKWKSLQAERFFLDGIKKADLVFYNGHSRDGGGPDFAPPKLLPNQHVAYHSYRQKTPGVKKMQQSFRKDADTTKLIGLFSCVSENLIPPDWQRSKKIAWISNKQLVYYADALQMTQNALSAFLGMHCQQDFEKILMTNNGMNLPNHQQRIPVKGVRILNFFKEPKQRN